MHRRSFFQAVAAAVSGLFISREAGVKIGNLNGFDSGLTGWQITPGGNAEFNNIWARGELHAEVFVQDEVRTLGSMFFIGPMGTIDPEFVLPAAATPVEVLVGLGRNVDSMAAKDVFTNDLHLEPMLDSPIFTVGEVLRVKFFADAQAHDIWFEVVEADGVNQELNRQKVRLVRLSGGEDGMVVPAWTPLISYGMRKATAGSSLGEVAEHA